MKIRNLVDELFLIPNTWKNILYIHVPFCMKKCNFCVFPIHIRNNSNINLYLNRLIEEIGQHYNVINGVSFSQLLLGGGSPSILTSSQLDFLFSNVPNIESIPFKSIEMHPIDFNLEKLRVLKKYKFNNISFGIQSFNAQLLDVETRIWVSEEKLKEIVTLIQNEGITVGIDILNFGDSQQQWKADMRILSTNILPDSICLQYLEQYQKTDEILQRFESEISEIDTSKYIKILSPLGLNAQEKVYFTNNITDTCYIFTKPKHPNLQHFFFLFPSLPILGYNIYSLGQYEDVFPFANYFFVKMFMGKELIQKLSILNKKHIGDLKTLLHYVAINREKLGIGNEELPANFFKDIQGEARFKGIIRELLQIPIQTGELRSNSINW